jgi:mRNA interferase HicA
MKRRALVKHLEACGCRIKREGKHTIYENAANEKATAVPRHSEINDFLARKICRDLEIPQPD